MFFIFNVTNFQSNRLDQLLKFGLQKYKKMDKKASKIQLQKSEEAIIIFTIFAPYI